MVLWFRVSGLGNGVYRSPFCCGCGCVGGVGVYVRMYRYIWYICRYIQYIGRRFAVGYEEVMQSWGDLFVVQQAHWGQKIAVTGVLP